MNKLKIKRKSDAITDTKNQKIVRLNSDSYERIMEVADESGESIRSIASMAVHSRLWEELFYRRKIYL